MSSLSVVIPVYNEAKTIVEIIQKVQKVDLGPISKEIVIVDDCSTDGTQKTLKEHASKMANVRIFYHEKNMGKGAALRTGFSKVSGDYVIVQDADLEYDPEEYPLLLKPLLADKADVVYGSRFMGGQPHRVHFFWHSVGNQFLTLLSNMFTNLNLTDMETCYKAFKAEALKKIVIRENRFGFEPEITAKIAKQRFRIFEIGISYYGRGYDEGKKIGWKDGMRAIWCILKYNVIG
jgi:glycosyltransferase involved in cell wall biosynthesis